MQIKSAINQHNSIAEVIETEEQPNDEASPIETHMTAEPDVIEPASETAERKYKYLTEASSIKLPFDTN